jgi:hypothetical protein
MSQHTYSKKFPAGTPFIDQCVDVLKATFIAAESAGIKSFSGEMQDEEGGVFKFTYGAEQSTPQLTGNDEENN